MPSQLSNYVIELCQQSGNSDYSGWLSLMITIIGWPIVYYLGRRTSKRLEINKCIDQLDLALVQLRDKAIKIDTKFQMSDYHAIIALYNYVNLSCKRIEEIDKTKVREKNTLRSLKRISTDELFIPGKKDGAVSKILALQVTLNSHYKKSI